MIQVRNRQSGLENCPKSGVGEHDSIPRLCYMLGNGGPLGFPNSPIAGGVPHTFTVSIELDTFGDMPILNHLQYCQCDRYSLQVSR